MQFTNMYLSCIHVSEGVSTLTKFDSHIYHGYPVICKSISPLTLYGSGFVVVYIVYEHFHRSLHI